MRQLLRPALVLSLISLLVVTILIQQYQIRQHQNDYAALVSQLSHVRTLYEKAKNGRRFASEDTSNSRRDAPASIAALAPGTIAPEWSVSEWTDGKTRSIADYRGKVVVIDFWGEWCSPCIRMIPEMKKLNDRFKAKQVVFLGVHTAGSEVDRIREVMDRNGWEIPVGLDSGESILNGETIGRYAITTFPSLVVLDGKGRIAFNGADPDFVKGMLETHAAENKQANQLQQALGETYGEMIEAVLSDQSD